MRWQTRALFVTPGVALVVGVAAVSGAADLGGTRIWAIGGITALIIAVILDRVASHRSRQREQPFT